MKAWGRAVGLAAVAAWTVACEPLDELGGGGGGGGGAFSSGVVFVRNGSAGRDVYAVDDAGNANAPTRLTTEGSAYEPTVSRNGLLVAFVYHSSTAWELRTVPTTGTGTASTVLSSTASTCSGCSNFHTPAISPAGDSIVFTLTKNGTSAVGKVNVDGSGFQVLTSGTSTYGAPSFYPDGRSVLVVSGSSGRFTSLVNVNLATGTANTLTSSLGNSGAISVVSRAVVSPDGTRVAFDAQTTTGAQIFVGQLASPGLTNVTQLTRHTGEPNVLDTWPSWRGNSDIMFQSNSGGGDNLYRISTTTSGAGSLVVPSVIEPSYGGA